jgi:hypothetical protein
MGKHIHKLSNIDIESQMGVCAKCGPTRITPKETKVDGSKRWLCYTSHMVKYFPWRVFKKGKCEHCGFIPVNLIQLEVDHIDGNKKNNDPLNLQTLCANCHKLKTFINKDFLHERPKV